MKSGGVFSLWSAFQENSYDVLTKYVDTNSAVKEYQSHNSFSILKARQKLIDLDLSVEIYPFKISHPLERDFENPLKVWNYEKLNETDKISRYIKEQFKNYDFS